MGGGSYHGAERFEVPDSGNPGPATVSSRAGGKIPMMTLRSFVLGSWVEGSHRATLFNPSTEEPLAEAGTGGIDFAAAADHARRVGGPALRSMTFAERGEMLRALSRMIYAHRDELLALGIANVGNTRSDSKFDLDGATGTLSSYAELGISLGNRKFLLDGEGISLGRGAKLWGQHILTPRTGVAVHINAFNFPAWGMMEKAAVALLAGVPILSKPATSTALVAHRIMELIVESGLVPPGAFSFLAGSVGPLLDHLGPQDSLAFTGSSTTAALLRSHPAFVERAARINMEADSLNCALLGHDVEPGSETWNLFIGDVAREMTQKAGQKCTAVRRIYVPAGKLAATREALAERLGDVRVGNPAENEVTMGPLTTRDQHRDVREGVEKLLKDSRVVWGDPKKVSPIGVPEGKGFFQSPLLLECENPTPADSIHNLEVFGPVATLMPYDGRVASVAPLVAAGTGSLVSSIYSDDLEFVGTSVAALAPYHGRLVLGSNKIAGQSIPPGAVLPQLVHGGPGRAGGGEELGGMRGLQFYFQRTALQGAKVVIEKVFGSETPGAPPLPADNEGPAR